MREPEVLCPERTASSPVSDRSGTRTGQVLEIEPRMDAGRLPFVHTTGVESSCACAVDVAGHTHAATATETGRRSVSATVTERLTVPTGAAASSSGESPALNSSVE